MVPSAHAQLHPGDRETKKKRKKSCCLILSGRTEKTPPLCAIWIGLPSSPRELRETPAHAHHPTTAASSTTPLQQQQQRAAAEPGGKTDSARVERQRGRVGGKELKGRRQGERGGGMMEHWRIYAKRVLGVGGSLPDGVYVVHLIRHLKEMTAC